MSSRTLLLYGQSLLLSGVAASLGHSSDLQVVQAATWAEVEALLAKRMPDVLIFDLAVAWEGRLLALLCTSPHLVLVGLDAECNRAVLLTGQERRALTLERVEEIVLGTQI